jgi:heavy metal-(Cd/Co/Hg/Pb/Zn)-translocating P-type ATPase
LIVAKRIKWILIKFRVVIESILSHKQGIIAVFTFATILIHLILRFILKTTTEIYGFPLSELPLIASLMLGGIPLVIDLLIKLFRLEFGSDLLAGISIVTSVLLGQYLAGSLVVLMLSGGKALEAYAVRSASSVLKALVKRMPSVAHLKKSNGEVADISLEDVRVGNILIVFPHEICPVDGTVIEGHGVMDESYLTGEPYMMSKTPGSDVLSGAINGEQALTIRANKLAVDSRYAKIMQVMRESEQRRPRIRRLGDRLGAFYTPLAVCIALIAWVVSGEPVRFLAVMVVATPCPLLIAIPVAIIGTISLAARRGIIIKDPTVLESIDKCQTAIFDKTGTLTYGRPRLTEIIPSPDFTEKEVLNLVASLERYSKHPLSGAILDAAKKAGLNLLEVSEISERPGEGLIGTIGGHKVWITSRTKLIAQYPEMANKIPLLSGGLECVVMIDGSYAGTFRFRDQPRTDGARESEVRYLADQVGIKELYFGQSPEQKLELVREETKRANTVFLGDGINDAPALMAATVGIAFGQQSDVTTEAAGVVIMEKSLKKVDEFLHVSRRMHFIILQSAVGGMILSIVGMVLATVGLLPPVAGAIAQEIIDVFAVVNALRASLPPKSLSDY